MKHRIHGQAAYCRERSLSCLELSQDPTFDAVTARDLHDMHERWKMLADTYELATEISGYIEWQAKRVEPPPGFELHPTTGRQGTARGQR